MAIPDELSCQELVELVTDYVEGTLTPSERARFEAHLGICTGCRHFLDQMQRTIHLVGRLTEDDIPADARDHLLRVFRHWKQRD